MKKFKPSQILERLQDVFIIDENSDDQLDFAEEATQYIEHLEKALAENNIAIPKFVLKLDDGDEDDEEEE